MNPHLDAVFRAGRIWASKTIQVNGFDRVLNHRPDADGQVLVDISHFLSKVGKKSQQLASEWDNSPHSCIVLNQGGLGSCWWHAMSSVAVLSFNTAGKSLGFIPSQVCGYRIGRIMDRNARNWYALTDTGTDSVQGLQAVQTYGLQPMLTATVQDPQDAAPRHSDCSLANVNVEPTDQELECDWSTRLIGQYSVQPDTTQAFVDDMRQVVQSGTGTHVCAFVDTAWCNWKAGDPAVPAPDMQDPNGGGHALALEGFRYNSKTKLYEWKLKNSWDVDWGDKGFVWCSTNWLRKAYGIQPCPADRKAA